MPIDFPNSPSANQSFTAGGSTWIWDGTAWTLQRITTGAQGPQGEVGPQGPTGPTGPQGTSINVKASVATVAALPSTGNSANDARIVQSDGDLYIWGGTSWTTAGQIVGPEGAQGIQGIQGLTGSTGATGSSGGITLSITSSGGIYIVNGANNPVISFIRGHRYVLNINAASHPFYFQTSSGAYNAANVYTSGVTGSGIGSGTIIFEVPYDAPSILYYVCSSHSNMGNSITVSDLGPTGATGATGTQGIQGIQGIQGLTGATGSQGAQGIQGTTGAASTVAGPTGPVGETFPSQTNNSGKFLSTNGTSTLWNTVAQYALPAQNGNSGKFLTTNGTAESWATVATTAYSNGTNTANSNKIFYNTTGTPPTGTAAGDLYIFY